MKRLSTRALAMLGATLVAATLAIVIPAQPASAATYCRAYTSQEYWYTSTKWGRVSIRPCLEVSGNDVRARVQWRVDWPTDCNLNVGLPATFSASCPINRATKVKALSFEGLKMGARLTLPGGATTETQCTFNAFNAGPYSSGVTKTCNGAWKSKKLSGQYRVTVFNVSADVANDGAGWKTMKPVTSEKDAFVGPF